jgi:hypothetical protein
MARLATPRERRNRSIPDQLFAWCDASDIQPVDIVGYVDTLRVWLPTPLSADDYRNVERGCANVQPIKQRVDIPSRERYALDLQQPTADALRILARRNDATVTRVDAALDWTFNTFQECDDAMELVDRHLVKRHHRFEHGTVHVKHTRYSGPHRLKNKIVVYPERFSRTTGEVDIPVLHLEYRMLGARALQQNGIGSPADVISLSHRQLWNERLLLYAFDPAHLGRMYWHWQGKHRRDQDRHIRIGGILCHGWRVQDVLDKYRTYFDVRKAMHRIPVDHLLPD